MKEWIVSFMFNKGSKIYQIFIEAKDYTKAYLEVCYKLPKNIIILEIAEKK